MGRSAGPAIEQDRPRLDSTHLQQARAAPWICGEARAHVVLARGIDDQENLYRKLGVIAGTKYLTGKETAAEMDRFYAEHKDFLTKSGRIAK